MLNPIVFEALTKLCDDLKRDIRRINVAIEINRKGVRQLNELIKGEELALECNLKNLREVEEDLNK